MATEEKVRFELQEYYDILMSANIKEKLKPFVRQFKKKNIPFIYQTLVNTIQVITGKHQIPLMKFNALMATKLFFDTGEYVPVVLIEIYLLPIIFQIAHYRIQKRSEEGLTLYFTEKGGFDPTKEMKRIGFNYVLLAIEFIFMSAQVKPHRNLENQELKEESNFVKVARILQEKGLRQIQNYKFYIPSYVNQTRKKYLKRLSKLSAEEYTDFFLKIICDQMNLSKKAELDMKKLFTFGDAYITIPLMHICEDELTNMETNFVNKKKYLILIGDFMKLGDIYAVLIITRSTFLENIFGKVQKVKGEIGFDAGEGIYPQVEASKTDKREFYIEFLKHIELWAHCHPVDEEGEPTDAKKIFQILKNQRKFVFPSNILINKIRTEMEENLKLNQRRNQKLIKLVDENSSEYSKKKLNSSFRQSKVSKRSEGLKVNSYIQFDDLQQMVLQAKKKLNLIIEKDKIDGTIKALQKFKNFWQSNAEKNEIEADESGDIQIVLEEGDLCAKVIQMVLPVYKIYSKGMISFDEYKDRVDLLMKKEAEESVDKETSFQNGLPLQPQKSQPAQKFEDYYEKSSLSQLQSNIKRSELSVKSSHNQIREEPSKEEQSSSKISARIQNLPNLQDSEHLSDSRKSKDKKQESNISFQEESVASSRSNLKKISEKESLKSESLLQEQSFQRNSFIKRQPEFTLRKKESQLQQQSFHESIASQKEKSRSIRGKRSGLSNKRLINARSKSPSSQFRSKMSNQSQSVLSSESINYKDAIAKTPRKDYEEYYNQSKESFISSQKSIAEHINNQKPSNMPSEEQDIEQIKLNQSISINREPPYKQKHGKVYALASKYDDYYGTHEDRYKQSQLSKKSSKLRIGNSELSQGKQGSSKVFNKSENSMRQNSQNRQNNYTQSIISAYDSSNADRKQAESKIQSSKININSNLTKYQNILYPTTNTPTFALLAKYEEQQSAIHQPEFNPLLHSFHEERSMQMTNPSKISSFKDCFEVNNQIILAQEGKERLLKFTKTGKITNFIENAYPKQISRNSTIVDIISERNAKKSIESYRNLREKSRATENLSQRMKSLESFNKNMRMKILVKNQQSKNNISRDDSSRKVNLLKNSRAKGSEPVSFYNDTQSSHQPSETNLKSDAGDVTNNALDLNVSRLINPKIYSHYFPNNKSDKLKKCMLKSKSLLIKNEQFQIGCVTNKREKGLQISLFVTPLKDTIEDIKLSIMNDHNLHVKLYTQSIDHIKVNQQEYVNIQFQVENVPYVIPTLSFKFKTNRNYSHNHLLISIPLSFNKFFTFHPINEESLFRSNSKGNADMISIQDFKHTPKLINSDRIKESLVNFELIKKEGKIAYYGCQAYFKGKIFVLKFAVTDKGYMNLQGKNMTGDHKNTKFLQFLLVTYRQIFEYIKKDKPK